MLRRQQGQQDGDFRFFLSRDAPSKPLKESGVHVSLSNTSLWQGWVWLGENVNQQGKQLDHHKRQGEAHKSVQLIPSTLLFLVWSRISVLGFSPFELLYCPFPFFTVLLLDRGSL
ncbi:hypothetical protein ACQJBY_071239 [Aegilops geniculata]